MEIIWNDKVHTPDDPYLIRWGFVCKLFSIRIHRWLHSDDLRNPHDHAWNFFTLVLRGGYTNRSPDGDTRHKAGRLYYHSAGHIHSVDIDPGGCWTILFTGPEVRPKWGFWVKGKFRKRNKYFYEWGHHRNDNTNCLGGPRIGRSKP